MADPRLGAFGAAGLALVLLARFGAFASMLPSPLAVAGLWSGSRTAMAVTARAAPYARPGRLASAFLLAPAPGPPRGGAAPAAGGPAVGAGPALGRPRVPRRGRGGRRGGGRGRRSVPGPAAA